MKYKYGGGRFAAIFAFASVAVGRAVGGRPARPAGAVLPARVGHRARARRRVPCGAARGRRLPSLLALLPSPACPVPPVPRRVRRSACGCGAPPPPSSGCARVLLARSLPAVAAGGASVCGGACPAVPPRRPPVPRSRGRGLALSFARPRPSRARRGGGGGWGGLAFQLLGAGYHRRTSRGGRTLDSDLILTRFQSVLINVTVLQLRRWSHLFCFQTPNTRTYV